MNIEGKEIIIEGEFKKEEVINYSKKEILSQTINFSVFGLLIIIISIVLIVLKSRNVYDSLFLPWLLLCCGILIIILPLILVMFIPKVLEKQNKAIVNGFIYKVNFKENEFNIEINSSESQSNNTYKYNLITRVKIINDCIFLYMNSSSVYMLKLTSFKSEEEKNSILNLIQKR